MRYLRSTFRTIYPREMSRYVKILIVPWFTLIALCAVKVESDPSLITEFRWKYFDYVWKSPEQKKWYEANHMYDPQAFSPIDVDRSSDGRTFVTIIKVAGVPASLHTISKQFGESGPLLEPYPDWSWYDPTEPCAGIVNVYRVAIDECNRLWVLDTGSIDGIPICPSKLLAFDLSTDKLILKQELQHEISYSPNGKGLLVTPIIQTEGLRCEDTTIYIADTQGRALIVWRNLEAVRLEEPDVYGPQEPHTIYEIANETFHLDDGVLGMALSPKLDQGNRFLLFRPMASLSMHAADTQQLQATVNDVKHHVDYIIAKDVLPSQATAQAFASDGTLFYGLTTQIAIGCFNIQYPMITENFKIAVTDHDRLQFASGMKVFRDPAKPEDEYLLIMTNKLQKIYQHTLKLDEYNFHVMRANAKHLAEKGGCTKKK